MITNSVFGRASVAALSAQQSAEWDRAAREAEGVPERVLMENAGRAVAALLHAALPRGRVLAVAGSGHNGGDALVAARTLLQWGREVRWIAAGARAPDLAVLHGHPLECAPAAGFELELARADVVIDGILGTGSGGPARAPAAAAITAINAAGRAVVAVDLPSGVDATSGQVGGPAVDADLTVTFGAPKIGLMLHPARAHCGRLIAVEIGFPPRRLAPLAELITPEWVWQQRPRRPATAHKGTAGRLLLVAGSRGMAGAAILAGRGALSVGAGHLRLASAGENRSIIQQALPAATFSDYADVLPHAGARVIIVGCGLGTDARAADVLERVLTSTDRLPLVLDADALNLLSAQPERLAALGRERHVLITPHVRELSRIAGTAESAIVRDPIGCASEFAARSGAVVLLKGQPSIIASAGLPVLVNTVGSSDLATAGMGDQLAGVIGAFAAAGADLRTAAGLALFTAGRAADLARLGSSLSPDDVSLAMPAALRSPGRRRPPFGFAFVLFDQPQRR